MIGRALRKKPRHFCPALLTTTPSTDGPRHGIPAQSPCAMEQRQWSFLVQREGGGAEVLSSGDYLRVDHRGFSRSEPFRTPSIFRGRDVSLPGMGQAPNPGHAKLGHVVPRDRRGVAGGKYARATFSRRRRGASLPRCDRRAGTRRNP